ncbi:ependymin-related protein 1-like [Liolophura sinensis]|uniref:ependymin-related protein 1-like n=1 Tax=Liolophura sinensis TaxID=3198878 RepID=UPI003158C427
MRVLLLLATVLAGVTAQAPCCFPAQWEAFAGILEGYYLPSTDTPGEVEGYDWVSYDYVNKRLMSNLSLVTDNDTPIRGVVIIDFKKGRRYDIFGNNCTSKIYKGDIPKNCVPDNANSTGPSYFGAGNNKLVFNSFQFLYNNLPVFMTFTQRDCIPVSETVIGGIAPGIKGFVGITYTGLTVGIKDPRVFEPPKDCYHSNEEAQPGGSLGSVIGRKKRGLD